MDMSSFSRLKSISLQDQILERLKALIQNGALKAGELMPSERDLAASLGVSRIPLREALNKLQALGVIEVSHGKKSLIKGMGGIPILEIIELISGNENELKVIDQLTEFRLILEVETACLASQRRDDKDLEKMVNLIEEMKKHYSDCDRLQDLSLKFHLTIAESAHNKILFLTSLFLYDLHRRSRKFSKRIQEEPLKVVKDHEEIYEAIKNKNCNIARVRMKDHLEIERNLQLSLLREGGGAK